MTSIAKEPAALRHTHCPLCGSYDILDHGTFIRYDGKLYDCQSCDSSWAHPLPSEEYLTKYYQGFRFQSNARARNQIIEKWRMDRKAKNIRNILKKYGNKPTAILDYGGGGGAFSLAFRRIFPESEVSMFDLDRSEYEYLTRNGIRAISEIDRKYTFIFSSHVIEHTLSPIEYFRTIYSSLENGGLAILAMPNRECRELWRMGYFSAYKRILKNSTFRAFLNRPWFCIDPPRHLWALSTRSVRMLAERTGFIVLETGTEFAGVASLESNSMYSLTALGNIKRPLQFLRNILVTSISGLAKIIVGNSSTAGNNLYIVIKKKEDQLNNNDE